MRRLAAALLACAAWPCAGVETGARWYVQVDNDSVIDTDRWYSSGLRIARVQPRGDHELEVGLVQEVFTPESERFVFGVVDRAPTARLLLSVARHDRLPGVLQTIELAAGVRGPAALGEEVTDLMHRLVSASDIVWSRQEPNRFDAQLVAARTHGYERFNVHYGAVLGNEVAFAHAGAELRFGASGAPSPALRYAPTPPWAHVVPPGGKRGLSPVGWGAFVGASVRAVARNEMLKRPYGVAGREIERRDAVGRGAVGVTWARPGIAANLALVGESREFEGQRAAHAFASLTVHVDF